MPPVFADLYKPVKDLLGKSYNGDSNKLNIKANDAASFNPVLTRAKDGKVTGTASFEYKYNPCEYAHLKMKHEIGASGNLKTKATMSKMAEGLVVEANADMAMAGDASKDAYDVKAEYKTKNATFIAEYKTKDNTACLSKTFEYDGLVWGSSATYDVTKGAITKKSIGAQFAVSKDTTTAVTLDDMSALKAGFLTSAAGMKLAAEYSTKIGKVDEAIMSVGCEKKLEGGQTFKGKLTTAGIAAVSLQHKLFKELTMCASCEYDSKKGASKFGTEFTFSA